LQQAKDMLLEAGDLADHVGQVTAHEEGKGMERRELAENYLQTLNLHTRELDFDFLSDLVRHHVATFAFSSVGCQLGDDLPLDLESLYRRIVVKKRGGYCFEQNGLLFGVLEELGLFRSFIWHG
ncbi:Arylamine N-acetyltransferase like protein, partial [Aduncisulcus paluster]